MTGEQQVLLILRDLTETLLRHLPADAEHRMGWPPCSVTPARLRAGLKGVVTKSVSSKYINKDPATKKDRFNIEATLTDQSDR
jgi:hypothetical protein